MQPNPAYPWIAQTVGVTITGRNPTLLILDDVMNNEPLPVPPGKSLGVARPGC